MKIPKQITIGKVVYKIKRIFKWFGKAQVGGMNFVKETLLLRKELKKNPEWESRVFFHEIGHAILRAMETNFPFLAKHSHDEDFVNELSLHIKKVYEELIEEQNRV